MLTEDQKEEMCKELASCHAYREQLSSYEHQALLHYAKGKQTELARWPKDEQTYYRLIFPVYNAADKVVTLLTKSVAEAALMATGTPAEASKLSLRQIALLHIYTGQQIPNNEADTIAQAHGHSSGQTAGALPAPTLPPLLRSCLLR